MKCSRTLLSLFLIFSYCTLCFGADSLLTSKNINSLEAKDRYFLVDGCQIYNLDGVLVRNYFGGMCVFFDDGTLVASDNIGLSFYDKTMKRIALVNNINPHHEMNKDLNGNILVLGSDFGEFKNKKIRYDSFYLFSSRGVKLASFSFKDHHQFILDESCTTLEQQMGPHGEKIGFGDDSFELSHFNSIYSVPRLLKGTKNKKLKEGYLIANSSSCQKIYIFDSKLKGIVSTIDKNVPPEYRVLRNMHDVQPMPDGKFLVYRNVCDIVDHECSSIDLVSEDFKKIYASYKRKMPEKFFSAICGGVNLLNDQSFIFSELINETPRVRHADFSGKLIRDFKIQWTKDRKGIQRIQLLDLNQFLKNNAGP